MTSNLTMKKALESNRLNEFIAQEEASGGSLIGRDEYEIALLKQATASL